MISLSIGGSGGAAISRALGVASEMVGDMRPIWESVVIPWYHDHMRRQFATDGAHGGRPWVGYGQEPRYAAIKQSIVGHNRLLRWDAGSGFEMLYPSLTDPGHPQAIVDIRERFIRLGTAVPHAGDIERSTRGPKWSGEEPSPPRYVMVATDMQKRALLTQIHRKIREQLAGVGLEIKDARIAL